LTTPAGIRDVAALCGSDQIARGAAELLLAAIAGHPCPGVHALPCRLVIRESSAGG
jgi:DNA-binding LacI/PurR family transcriptional regulator